VARLVLFAIAELLGIGLVVTGVHGADSTAKHPQMEIRAFLASGARAETIRARGSKEAAAWRELAALLVARHNANERNVQYWLPGV
jgi:hypothetical protein